MKKILYIAGPMRGYHNLNTEAFYEAEVSLIRAGYAVLNPARHHVISPEKTVREYFIMDMKDLMLAEGIALLPGWHSSQGANCEYAIAGMLEIPTMTLSAWINIGPEPSAQVNQTALGFEEE